MGKVERERETERELMRTTETQVRYCVGMEEQWLFESKSNKHR